MTAITPETGLRARLRRLAVLVIAAGACTLGVPGSALAADAPADSEQSVELHVTAGLRGTVAPGTSTSATVTVENDTDAELSEGQVDVELSRTPLADEAAVTEWLDDGEAPGSFLSIGGDSTETVESGGSTTTTVFVPEDTLNTLAPGVYPVRAALSGASTGGDGERAITWNTTATSVLVVAPSSATQIGVLVPITATPTDGALLSAEELAALTAPDGALTAQLDGVAGTTAVLAVDPAIPTAIRVLGSAAPEQAREWLDRLDELPNARFALQFGDADATVQAQAGLSELLAPTSLSPFIDPADFPQAPQTGTPTEGPDGTPDPSPASTPGTAVPDDASLTALDGALPLLLWPEADLTQTDLASFAAYLGEGTTTVVPSSAVGGQSAAHAAAGGQDLLITDTVLSSTLSDAAAEPDSAARQRLLAEASAQLFLAQNRAPGAPLLVGLERDETRTADALREAVSAADSIGFELAAVRATPPVEVVLPETAEASRAADLTTLLADEQTLTAFSSILADPQVLLSPERIRIMRTIAVGSSPAAFATKFAEHRARTTATLGAVSIPPSSTIQLLTANADLPIAVRNDLPWPVSVQLYASPTDPRLEVKPVTETVVQAASTTRVKVPVSARVGSGEVDLRLSLYSPTGVPIQDQQTIRVAVRAEWETIGLAVFGGLAALLIVLGVVRTVRRKRREAIEEQAVEVAVEELIEEKEAEAAELEREHPVDRDEPPTKENP